MHFHNKVVVITGGANGIGKCLVEEFARSGAKVAVIDLDPKAVPCDLYYCGDIAEQDVVNKFVDKAIERFKTIDYLINNACLSKKGILSECSYEDFNYVLRVGVTAPYELSKRFLPYFNKNASIVNISSTRAFMSQEDTESYSAAKGGITALTHALSVSLAGRVRVNSISPGWIDTTDGNWSKEDRGQHPVKRIGNPMDIAKAVMFLCSDASGFITGENITIDGGMSKQMIYHMDHGWSYEGNIKEH
ncbi:SDR family oxidoreductase [Mobilitalea sibirica]|uniref:SDR family oxidoreductase n=1 Tax=Mobilitalea sibirica TaxID=1462919 RepID=A0A8J7H2A0_9FIRM|nr:SDR family oxidoreductase [Mobilitalea sibirica]MBH1940847.1 SDR family oxidoreductase [Mobilitalea sibirica]